jgi:hypothetical protein
MKKILHLIFSYVLMMGVALAQSSPQPFDLNTGNYSFSTWDSASAAGTYPANMMLHMIGSITPNENTPATGDWNCDYNLNIGSVIKGYDTLGIAFRITTNTVNNTCQVNPDASGNVYVGDGTIALNTTDRENINVSWKGRMLSSFVYNAATQNTRFFGIACQYRIGTTGAFTNVPGNYLFVCNSTDTTYHPQFYNETLSSTLPAACNNQPVVEVRWIYHQTAQNSGGPRPLMAFDDIQVSSDPIVTNLNKKTIADKKFSVYPNPAGNEFVQFNKTVTYQVYNMIGQPLTEVKTGKTFDASALSQGLYLIKTAEGEIFRLTKQ